MKIRSVRSKNKDNRGRIRSHRARFGDLYADGLTAKEAEAALEVKLRERCNAETVKPTIVAHAGHVCLITQDLIGYNQHHVWPDGRVSESLGYTRQEAERSARLSIAQTLWTSENDSISDELLNTEELRREFAFWVKFQVAYRAARERGLDQSDAHIEACRLTAAAA